MPHGLVDGAERFLARHRTAATVVAIAWFWLGVAIAARFVELPPLPWDLSDRIVLWSGVAINIGWWGFLRPAIERRRAARAAAPAEPR